jgi:heme exporter protein CcmD
MLPEVAKYGPYIYSAYAIAIVALAGIVIWTVVRSINAKKKLDALESAEAKDAPAAKAGAGEEGAQ